MVIDCSGVLTLQHLVARLAVRILGFRLLWHSVIVVHGMPTPRLLKPLRTFSLCHRCSAFVNYSPLLALQCSLALTLGHSSVRPFLVLDHSGTLVSMTLNRC